MNVANRKLFANRDARKKLAEMGGILASSPELLGEAMKFAEAGQIDVQMYVINVPGLTAPGEYLKVSEETLMQLNDIVPQLMSQQETLVEPAEAVEGLVDVRPGDALLPKRLRDIGAIPDQAPVPTVQEPVDDRSIRDIVREGLASTYSKSPMEAILENLTPDSENPMVQMVESGLQSMGVEDPNAAISGPSGAVTGLTPSQKFQSESLNPMNIGPTELNLPAVRNALRDPNAPSAGLASGLKVAADEAVQENTDIPLSEMSDTRLEAEKIARQDTLPELGMDILEGVTGGLRGVGSYLTEKLGQGASVLGMPGVGATLMDQAENIDQISEQRRQDEAAREAETAASVAEVTEEQRVRKGFVPGGPGLAERQAGRGDLESINEQIKEDPTKLPNKFVIDLMKKNEDAYREAAFGKPDEKKDDGKAPPKPDPEKIAKMSAAEATNEYYKQLKEMFGLSDEDKARDLSLTMAQFGFAMAAGQSPNALTNIANAAGAALAQMRQTQATEREREDKLKLLAFTEARADEKEARELERLLAKESRADKRELALYISKLQAKAALDPDVKSYLETAEGKAALGMYINLIKDDLVDADDVVPAFIKTAGNLAPDFLTYLGLGAETGGSENAGTGTTIGDIK